MPAPAGYLVALRTALVAKLNADPYFASLVPQGVTYRPTRAPVDLPAVVFRDSGVRADNVVPLHDRALYFDVFAVDLDPCEALATIVNGLLDNQALALPGDQAQVAYMSLRGDEDQADYDADVVRKMLTYRLLVYDFSGPDPWKAP